MRVGTLDAMPVRRASQRRRRPDELAKRRMWPRGPVGSTAHAYATYYAYDGRAAPRRTRPTERARAMPPTAPLDTADDSAQSQAGEAHGPAAAGDGSSATMPPSLGAADAGSPPAPPAMLLPPPAPEPPSSARDVVAAVGFYIATSITMVMVKYGVALAAAKDGRTLGRSRRCTWPPTACTAALARPLPPASTCSEKSADH